MGYLLPSTSSASTFQSSFEKSIVLSDGFSESLELLPSDTPEEFDEPDVLSLLFVPQPAEVPISKEAMQIVAAIENNDLFFIFILPFKIIIHK